MLLGAIVENLIKQIRQGLFLLSEDGLDLLFGQKSPEYFKAVDPIDLPKNQFEATSLDFKKMNRDWQNALEKVNVK